MKILKLIYVLSAQAYYRWALAEIDPMHRDVSRIVHRKLELEDAVRRIFA